MDKNIKQIKQYLKNFALRDWEGSPDRRSNEEILAEKCRIINEQFFGDQVDKYLDAKDLLDVLCASMEYYKSKDTKETSCCLHLINVLEYLMEIDSKRPESLAVYKTAEVIAQFFDLPSDEDGIFPKAISNEEEEDEEISEEKQLDLDFKTLFESGEWEAAIETGDMDELNMLFRVAGNTYVPDKDYASHPIDAQNHTGLWLAVTQKNPNIEVIKFLLDKGASTTMVSDCGYPSHWDVVDYNLISETIRNAKDEVTALEIIKLIIEYTSGNSRRELCHDAVTTAEDYEFDSVAEYLWQVYEQ